MRWVFSTHKYSILQLSLFTSCRNTLKQCLSDQTALVQQLHYSTCFKGDSSNRTVSGRLQHTIQDHTLQQSTSLSTDTGREDCTAQISLIITSPDPTAKKSSINSLNISHASQQPALARPSAHSFSLA
jgi:hypothetical protein